ncbi:MAG: magnesium transporter CorA family protein [Eubacteriaceae bacterium]|nr:magnesium transporter CorA family protein [Eubacteriaceae bacterium]
MISIYYTENEKLIKSDVILPDSWVHLINPTQEEIQYVYDALSVDIDFLRSSLDEEERARLEVEDGHTMVIFDTPLVELEGEGYVYNTIPVGIVLTENNIITISLKDVPVLKYFYDFRMVKFSSKKRNRMFLQILYRNAALFLTYLKQVDKMSTKVEEGLHKSMKNKELIQMLKLEKSLVYFATSLKSNEVVMEKLLRMAFIKKYPDDLDLLEDVIIENKQAIEMCNIYRDILSGTMDAFASIISNNLNIVMKLLTSLTIIIAIPTLIASLWGMNVAVPFKDTTFGFWMVMGIALVCSFVSVIVMIKKKML